jgi:hypothetical protein
MYVSLISFSVSNHNRHFAGVAKPKKEVMEVKIRIFPGRRSRFDQCRRKLGILRKKRGRLATGGSLLLSVIESLKHQDSKAAMEEMEKYSLLIQNLTCEDRAIVDSLCRELRKFADKDAMLERFWKVAIWPVAVIAEEIIRRAVNLLIYHAARKATCSTRYCHEGFAPVIRR